MATTKHGLSDKLASADSGCCQVWYHVVMWFCDELENLSFARLNRNSCAHLARGLCQASCTLTDFMYTSENGMLATSLG